ncbi:MAG: DUF2185 domain-containing protein [Ruminococcus sp.]|nr:DUF2185 domain-containing protein [Ruminococcus sp.]
MNIRDAFSANLKFICETQLDAGLMRRTFSREGLRDTLVVGTVDLPTGRIRVGDPLTYMGTKEFSPELDKPVAPGSYPVELAFIRTAFDTVRITASRIKLTDKKAVRYELAAPTHETAAMHASDGDAPGFPVDAGVMSFMDASVMEEYADFLSRWHAENPQGNHYDDFFAALFAESFERFPEHQRRGGDFIEWALPKSGHRFVMNASGFGDGFYQIFRGLDEDSEVCEIVVPLINADILEQADRDYLAVWDGLEACIVSNHIAEGGEIAYMSREGSGIDSYNGWVFYGCDEDEDYWADASNFTLYSTHGLADRFPGIIPLLHSPEGSAFIRLKDGSFIPDDR